MKRTAIGGVVLLVLGLAFTASPAFAAAPKPKDLLEQGWASADAGNLEKALVLFEQVVKAQQKNAEAWYGVGYLKSALGRKQEAVQAYEQAVRYKPNHAEAYINLAVAYDEVGEHEKAVEASQKAIKLKPDAAAAHGNLASAYLALQRFEEALTESTTAIKLDGSQPFYHFQLGESYYWLRQFSRAIGEYEIFLRSPSPIRAVAHDRIGCCYVELGLPGQAVVEFQEAVRLKPDFAQGYQNLGVAYAGLGRFHQAVDACQKLVALQPDSFEALLALGANQAQDKQLAEAAQSFQKAISMIVAEKKSRSIELHMANDYWKLNLAYLSLGQVEAMRGNFNEAVDALWKAAQTSNTDHKTQAEAYRLMMDMTEAALTNNPDDPALHYILGLLLHRKGQYQEAVIELERAAELNPRLKDVYVELGRCYGELGDQAKEVAWLENGLLWSRGTPGPIMNWAGRTSARRISRTPSESTTS